MGSSLRIALALVVVAVMATTAFVYRRYTDRQDGLEATVLEHVAQLLEEEYVRPVQLDKLLGGAEKGLREALKAEKLATDDLPKVLKTGDRKDRFASVYQLLAACEKRAHGKLTREELTYAAIRGMLGSLDDPYCDAFTPEENQEFEEEMQGGNFGGIGIYIEEDPDHSNRLTVTEPIEGTPAHKAGLRPGDWLTKIGDTPTAGMTVEDAAKRIRGPVGTEVTVWVKRPGKQPQPFTMKRAIIHVSSVNSKMLDNRIGYLRLRIFGEETTREFSEELEELRQMGARALILDLRNNGGGYVNAAQDVCSHFLDPGKLVVSVVNGRTSRNETLSSSGDGPIRLPMVVLINRFSASASEITAGALQDHHVATLMGETSYGKASVQTLFELEDGGAVKYTVAHYLTPEGRDIHEKGIEPDVPMKDPEQPLGSPQDVLLQAAVQRLQKTLVRL